MNIHTRFKCHYQKYQTDSCPGDFLKDFGMKYSLEELKDFLDNYPATVNAPGWCDTYKAQIQSYIQYRLMEVWLT